MAKAKKLINKMERRQRFVREHTKDIPKLNKAEETLAASPRAEHLMLSAQRRYDTSFGYDTVGHKPYLEVKVLASALARHDFGGSDFGLLATLAGSPTSPAKVEISKVTTVADVSGSLNSKYFLVDTPTTDYYVWFNINSAGVDPLVVGRTAVPITGATNVTANTLAASVASALDALSTLAASAVGAVVTITDSAAGPAPDTHDGVAPTGFTFQTVQQGTSDSGTVLQQYRIQPGDTVQMLDGVLEGRMLEVISLIGGNQLRLDDVSTYTSESDILLRVLLSGEPKSYF